MSEFAVRRAQKDNTNTEEYSEFVFFFFNDFFGIRIKK